MCYCPSCSLLPHRQMPVNDRVCCLPLAVPRWLIKFHLFGFGCPSISISSSLDTQEQTNPYYAAIARTFTRSLALYFSRPVRLFRPSKGATSQPTRRATILTCAHVHITSQWLANFKEPFHSAWSLIDTTVSYMVGSQSRCKYASSSVPGQMMTLLTFS